MRCVFTEEDRATARGCDNAPGLRVANLDELKQTIDLRRDQGFDAARAVVLTGKGKAVMDQIRTLLSNMGNAESSSARWARLSDS